LVIVEVGLFAGQGPAFTTFPREILGGFHVLEKCQERRNLENILREKSSENV